MRILKIGLLPAEVRVGWHPGDGPVCRLPVCQRESTATLLAHVICNMVAIAQSGEQLYQSPVLGWYCWPAVSFGFAIAMRMEPGAKSAIGGRYEWFIKDD